MAYQVRYRLYGIITIVEVPTLEEAKVLAKQLGGIVWFG